MSGRRALYSSNTSTKARRLPIFAEQDYPLMVAASVLILELIAVPRAVKSNDDCDRNQSCGNGVFRQLKTGFIAKEFPNHVFAPYSL